MSQKNFASFGDLETLIAEIVSKISVKVDKVSGKGLSTNDYTTADKNKVDALKTVAFSGSFTDLTDKPNNSNTFQGTIAEWNNLTTAEKKQYDHASIPDSLDGNVTFPASKVTYGNQSVKDALDALTSNAFGSAIDIKGTSGYTCPSDGYIRFRNNGSNIGNSYLSVMVNNVAMMGLYGQHIGYYEVVSLFVKKGMTIKDNGSTLSSYTLEFIPIS